MERVLEQIQKIGIVPVVVLNSCADAEPLAKALCEGGLPCAEVTFRTDAAEKSIRIMKEKFPEMIVGAGTVLSIEQAKRAIAAGAQFIVSPGVNPVVVQYCVEQGVPVTPGVTSPTEIDAAMGFGLKVLKFFPAEASGGLNAIKAMSAPYPMLKFMPTGGINEKNITSYIAFDKIIACGGSWMVSPELVAAGEFDQIKELTSKAMQTMLGFELMHVGINCENEEEADRSAGLFEQMFGFSKKTGNSSIFAGTVIEAMKKPYLGAKGHIAIGTNSVFRAVNYLEAQGFRANMETAKYQNDKLMSVYLVDEAAGFALHLLQK